MNELQDRFLQSYYQGHCLNPVRKRFFNTIAQKHFDVNCPCGKCFHCRMSHVNEWVTRLTLESQIHKYVYFVTLTYDSKKLHFQDENWSVYLNNYNKQIQLTPLVLNKKHLQNYFKRLRHKISFRYFACGEYGHKYGRPHYHLILYVDSSFVDDSIRSFITSCWEFGKVDINNLSTNGTLGNNSGQAFSYVCKYMLKKFDFDTLPTIKYIDDIIEYKYKTEVNNYLYEVNFSQFKKSFYEKISPFVVMSKSPFIASWYFEKYVESFKDRDYRLFGLSPKDSKKSFIFPKIFVRKSYDYNFNFISYKKYGHNVQMYKNRVPFVASALYDLLSLGKDSEVYDIGSTSFEDVRKVYISDKLRLYNKFTKQHYLYAGNCYNVYHYDRSLKKFIYDYSVDLSDVLNMLIAQLNSQKIYDTEVISQMSLNYQNLKAEIIELFGDLFTFDEALFSYSESFEKMINQKQIIYNNTKILF